MDELEFRQRVYANPTAPDQDILDAARDNPTYQKILDETQRIENDIESLVTSIVVPDGLKESLMNIPATDTEEQVSSVAGSVGTVASTNDKPAANAASFFQYYAIAASLLLVIGVTFTLNFQSGPTSAELAIGDGFIEHLYHGPIELASTNARENQVNVQWNYVNEVMSTAGVRLASTMGDENPVHYANPCNIFPGYNAVHIMMIGDEGVVNVMVIQNSPVGSEFQVQDDRFSGLVVPSDEGNVILVGEEGENLEPFKLLMEENMEWVI